MGLMNIGDYGIVIVNNFISENFRFIFKTLYMIM